MKDLTEKSIAGHILQMSVPIAAGMFFQTLYFLIDLYFVAHLVRGQFRSRLKLGALPASAHA
jgi:Na+-driven multidrug efflux pump